MIESDVIPYRNRIARVILVWFVLTFIASRAMVILIMTRRVPDMFLHVGGTHVHHLNYGIFLLSGVGAYLLLMRSTGRALVISAGLYGVGLALTFDEFGMWLHLGGSYWQRASYDAVVTIAAVFGLIAVAPKLRHFTRRDWVALAVVVIAVGIFSWQLADSVKQFANTRLEPYFKSIEKAGPQ
jgi:hypothetical protein